MSEGGQVSSTSKLEELGGLFTEKFSKGVEVLPSFRGEVSWQVEMDILVDVMEALRAEGFDYLVDVSSIDHGGVPRFEMVYEVSGMETFDNLRIKSRVAEGEKVPTVSGIWATANWHEREVYDMMGIEFEGHPDLRRILMWEGFPYFPLRKEFPLSGEESEMPDIAFSKSAPLEGGPFVTCPGDAGSVEREPRGKGQ